MGEPFQRVEHRHVRLARTVLIDAGPASDPYRRRPVAHLRRIEEGVYQRGFAHTRRSGDEHDLALTQARPGEHADSRPSSSSRPTKTPVSGCWLPPFDSTSPEPGIGDLGPEALVSAMKRKPRRCTVSMQRGVFGVVTQRQAQLADGLGQRVRRHGNVGPHGVQQILAAHQHARAIGQIEQDRPGFRPQRDCLARACEASAAAIDAEIEEVDRARIARRRRSLHIHRFPRSGQTTLNERPGIYLEKYRACK